MCYRVLQSVVVCCNVLQFDESIKNEYKNYNCIHEISSVLLSGHTATHCNTLQHTATHCNTLQHTTSHCNTLQRTATHCSKLQHALQHAVTHINTLQHTDLAAPAYDMKRCITLQLTTTRCSSLQHTVTYCNILYHTASHCNRRHLHMTSSAATRCNILQHTASHRFGVTCI